MDKAIALLVFVLSAFTLISGGVFVMPVSGLHDDWCSKNPNYYTKHKQYCDGYYECASPPYAGKDSTCKEYYNYCGNDWYYDRHDYCPNVYKKTDGNVGGGSNGGSDGGSDGGGYGGGY